uniref:Uncharacterized protein n=1 Tax=Triticum urartu TaxID=4572 RepID=A0A8R7U7P4_TRIUA
QSHLPVAAASHSTSHARTHPPHSSTRLRFSGPAGRGLLARARRHGRAGRRPGPEEEARREPEPQARQHHQDDHQRLDRRRRRRPRDLRRWWRRRRRGWERRHRQRRRLLAIEHGCARARVRRDG